MPTTVSLRGADQEQRQPLSFESPEMTTMVTLQGADQEQRLPTTAAGLFRQYADPASVTYTYGGKSRSKDTGRRRFDPDDAALTIGYKLSDGGLRFSDREIL